MRRTRLWLLAIVLAAAGAASAEEPLYKRLLQGEDAKKAAALQKQIAERWAAGKFAEAVAPAEELLALRKRVQGEDHGEAADAARMLRTLRRAAALPAEKQASLAQAPGLAAKAATLRDRGKYAEAEPLLRQALGVYEEVLGPKHPLTARLCNNLATNLEKLGRAREAEPLHRRALAIFEEVLGPRHPDTATGRGNLASNLDAQGRAKEAEPLHRKSLAACEEVLGPKHIETTRGYANLAANLESQGRIKDAEPLIRKALAVREEVLGPKHPLTAIAYNNLAANLKAQGRFQEAEPLLRKAVAIFEEVLGPRHPNTAIGCGNLALNLQEQGRAKEAESLHRRALAIFEEVLGAKHPYTAIGYGNLALSLEAQGRTKEAEPLHRKALVIKEEVLGPKHPETSTSCDNLAGNLQRQGRAKEAELLFRQDLVVNEEMLGPSHPNTARSYHNLAATLDEQGRFKEAEPLYRKALAVREAVLGPKHPATIYSLNNLARNLYSQGQVPESERLFRKVLAAFEEVLGPRHPDVATACNNLAGTLWAQDRFQDAEPLLRKALAIHEAALGARHPDVAQSCHSLAVNLRAEGKIKEAEPLLRKALAIKEEVLGTRHPDTVNSANSLASLLQGQGRAREAEPFWQKGAAGKEAARLRLAASTLDKAAALHIDPHLGLAACRARLERPREAWQAAEAGLGRSLLDDLAAIAALSPDRDRRTRDRAARLDAIDKGLIPLLVAEKLDETDRRRRDDLLGERDRLDREAAEEAADLSRQALLPLERIQERLEPDSALVFWIDWAIQYDHWGCVVRRSGPPAWVHLPGSGSGKSWTEADQQLPRLLRDDLARGEPDALRHARLLAAQRLDPLAPHLAATADLPAVRHLVIVPVTAMAGVPVEVLSDRYVVSYVPSSSVFARLRSKHRPLAEPTLLALGDPNFALPNTGMPPAPPDHGLFLALVLPGGNAARAGLRAGDILLRYGDAKLITKDDLKLAEAGERIPIRIWRAGRILDDLRLAPGKLDAVLSNDPPAVALRKRREREALADSRSRSDLAPLPGTRLEVAALAGLLPGDKATLLLGSRASEQELDALAASGKLRDFRLLHFATHGSIDPFSAAHSALALARDRLPNPEEQARLAAAGKRVCTGQLSVQTIARDWQLDADLVVLSACRTGMGPDGGGEGLLGFAQVLLGKGARSLLLSLWKVDDTATALLMSRFYQNLLGKREGLKTPLAKAEALQEAKRWLRQLRRSEVETLAGKLAEGVVRAKEVPPAQDSPQEAARPALPAGDRPFAHPRYWAAFILIGDPE
jgi:tetratricopeptide (TPR) repeat protein